jgi:hypothetical protein
MTEIQKTKRFPGIFHLSIDTYGQQKSRAKMPILMIEPSRWAKQFWSLRFEIYLEFGA